MRIYIINIIKFVLLLLSIALYCVSCTTNIKKQKPNNTSAGIIRCLNCDEKLKSDNPEYSKLKMVKLETSASCLIRYITQIEISDSVIFVLDNNTSVYAFDWEGRFIAQIGRFGQGPKALTLETGAGIATQSECQYYQGYLNMALICGGGGVNSFNTLKIT
jgi:hypothetical protein